MSSSPICPQCKADIYIVKPVRIATDPDSRVWKGRVPTAVGFTCRECGVLLPLSPTAERDDV
jgi:predicted nucleic-acid-binding Zn-ribbon protein